MSYKQFEKTREKILAKFAAYPGFPDLRGRTPLDPNGPDASPEKPARAEKKRGAPRGNQNARKHGLYSKINPSFQRGAMAKALDMDDLTHEVAIVRLMLDGLLADPNARLSDKVQLFKLLTHMVNANHRVAESESYD